MTGRSSLKPAHRIGKSGLPGLYLGHRNKGTTPSSVYKPNIFDPVRVFAQTNQTSPPWFSNSQVILSPISHHEKHLMFVHSQFLRLKQVKEITCLSKSSIYRLMEQGDFPKQVPLGARSVVWVKSQVEDWCAQKVCAALG